MGFKPAFASPAILKMLIILGSVFPIPSAYSMYFPTLQNCRENISMMPAEKDPKFLLFCLNKFLESGKVSEYGLEGAIIASKRLATLVPGRFNYVDTYYTLAYTRHARWKRGDMARKDPTSLQYPIIPEVAVERVYADALVYILRELDRPDLSASLRINRLQAIGLDLENISVRYDRSFWPTFRKIQEEIRRLVGDYTAENYVAWRSPRFALARYYEAQGNFYQALDFYEEVLRKNSSSQIALDKSAELREKMGLPQ